MTEADYSKLKGVADEKHFDEFIKRIGGERVDPLITRSGVKKADYLFRDAGVVVELKILETEFAHTEEAEAKFTKLLNEYEGFEAAAAEQAIWRGALEILRAPLQRIIRKANTQIRETKQELGLVGYEGVLLCVNDNFRGVSPKIAESLISHILAGAHFRSICASIYLTNHHIEHPNRKDALFLWAPRYSPQASDKLQTFINELGRRWFDYSEEQIGPFISREEHETFDLTPASVVTGLRRNSQYVDRNE
ncbi:hypothetical protein GOZ78_03200 [Agrobacterium vitis]|uniref:Uncharacterized protein n=1 Tax=Agrobacterium vitis TaxID=373 RepID=A0ABD6G8C6_AGRVI|nr:hypothetical protein [Agrobacterium vitis]MUO77905.1 hypothetical protein [Agrobacterium vitis]MUO93423.1 hypothetical protein [Agrobacterium vitis]MUP04774.1 hypothetical protein [Agrobacterium vitis]MVA09026.1 hypothetical protein [Agrobacterium vitis]MVA93080.1 hypothetical protein [Agrobacterium vitis]